MSEKSQQAITHILQADTGSLKPILLKVAQLQSLQAILSLTLDAKLSLHCQVANYDGRILTLMTESAMWTTHIRFGAADIITALRKQPTFQHLKQIICKIELPYKTTCPKPAKPPACLSKATSAVILETAETISFQKLKVIMERIATRTK
jgi:hypothetical protein